VAVWIPITQASAGETVTLKRIHELAEYNAELMTFLESNGLVPGAEVIVRELLPFNQTVTLEVGGKAVTLGFASAKYLFVQVGPKVPERKVRRPAP